MKRIRWTGLALALSALSLLWSAAPASAQITGGQVIVNGQNTLAGTAVYRNNIAFDSVNQVYLVITGGRPPLVGRWLDKDGKPIPNQPDFTIASEDGFLAWASVAFGGTSNDPAFLVTYLAADGSSNPKVGRLIRYRPNAAPLVSNTSLVTNVGGEWIYSEKAQNFWDGAQFVVGTRVNTGGQPRAQVNHFSLSGVVSAPQLLGDGSDYEGSPAIACSPGGVCMAMGFQAGIPTGYTGGSYARMFDSTTLNPTTPIFSLSSGNDNEDQGVVFMAHTGFFLVEWFRGGVNVIDTRLVTPGGAMTTLDLSKGIGGPTAGCNTIGYNILTHTALLATKDSNGAETVLELGDDGYPIRPSNVVTISGWDGRTPDYLPSMAVDPVNARWLVSAALTGTTAAGLVQGTAVAQTVLPPAIFTSATLPAGTVSASYSQSLIATGSTTPYTWTLRSGALPDGINLSGSSLAGTPTTPGDYAFRLRVTGGDAQFVERDFTLHINAVIVAGPGGAGGSITGTSVSFPGSDPFRNNLAFDSVHQVYLMITERPPVVGRFLNKNGVQIGADFPISDENAFTAWVSVASGGPANDPVFLVTYLAADGNVNPKVGRLIRYVPGGAPSVGTSHFITNVFGEWLYSEKATNYWDGTQFVVGTRISIAGSQPRAQVNHFDMSGNVSNPLVLGDGVDYEGSPAIACTGSGTCIAIGFAAGIPTGYSGGSYARLFSSSTLQATTGIFLLAGGSPNEDQGVVYLQHTGNFLAEWFRGGANVIDTRLIAPDGSMSLLDLTKGIGIQSGTNSVAYNPATQTTLLLLKGDQAALTALQLGDNGYPLNVNNTLTVTGWDGRVQDYLPSVAADPINGRWLATADLTGGGVGLVIQGTVVGGGSPPPAPISPTIGTSGSLPAGTVGILYSQALAASAGVSPYSWSRVSGAFPAGIGISGTSLTGTPTASGNFSFRLRVTGSDNGFSEQDFTLTINAAPPPGNPPTVPLARRGNDFDGDGKSDVAVFRPSNGTWWIVKSSTGTAMSLSLGQNGDVPVVGDYDGDGKADPAIFRASTSTWLIKTSGSNYATTLTISSFGVPGDIPVVGDYDGDGKADPAVFRPSTGQWIALLSSTNYVTQFVMTFGQNGDTPVSGDFDGDGKTDLAIVHVTSGAATWTILKSSSNYLSAIVVGWGVTGDVPVSGDFDGDGKTDIAVYRPSNGTWYILASSSGFVTFMPIGWGLAGDQPVVGDFDGDGKSDASIFRPIDSAWWMNKSSTNHVNWLVATWGVAGDFVLGRIQ